MKRYYIFPQKGIPIDRYLAPEEIKKYEAKYGKLIGVEANGKIIKAEKGENNDSYEQRDS